MREKQIKCGKVKDGFDVLTTLCEKEFIKTGLRINMKLIASIHPNDILAISK